MIATHRSPFSGAWYPERAADLERLLEQRFEASLHRTGRFLLPGALGYIVPHAAPAYSGTVAAAVYRCLQRQRPERIVLLAFPHRGGFQGLASPDVERISTPLGEVALDGDFGGFARVAEARVCDHSLEIQLPFLQKAAPQARLTPLYAGPMDAPERRAAAGRLAAAWRPGTVFLASSDFTHYGRGFGFVPFPADRAVAARLHELDHACLAAAGSLDSALFLETVAARGATVCGTNPIALLLDVLRDLGRCNPGVDGIYQSILDYQTSGEITGDYRQSVSYAALGFFPRSAFDLDAADRNALLDAAGETLGRLRRTGERRAAVAEGSDALTARRGAFVSLHQGEELLGCVGNCTGRKPLQEEIGDLTLAAALDDPRFRPAADLEGPIDIELSVLTPFRHIRDTAEFRLGRHGALLRLGGRSGLLLPQVAEHQHWTAEDFWSALARKSLLGPRAWCDPHAQLEIFEAQVFAHP
jgi:AmmeMemoRadiSam system protein B/AmmeMemoRadiSam system protein A